MTPYTAAEARAHFLQACNVIANNARTPSAAVFSMLALLDGCGSLPMVRLTLVPHETDEAYHKGNGDRWYAPETNISDVDGCMLHDVYARM